MRCLVILAVSGLLGSADADVSASQFRAVMRSYFAQYKDVTFVYEGEVRYVGPKDRLRGDPDVVFGRDFQGRYTFRSDGATAQDIYKRPIAGGDIITRSMVGLIDSKAEKLAVQADLRHAPPSVKTFNGPPAMLFQAASAKRMFYWWFFGEPFDPETQAYEFQGWEEVAGHRCLRVEMNAIPGSAQPQYHRHRFWIDLQRGGHPLRYEMIVQGAVRIRTDGVKLQKMAVEGGDQPWMPVGCTVETFVWEGKDYSYPFTRETYAMVNGSFRMNQGCPDRAFSLKEIAASGSQNTRLTFWREFERTPAFRTDPQGVQQRLDRLLSQADRVSKQLEASSPARSRWDWTTASAVGFMSIGGGVLVGALVRARKR